ncbi:MAG: amino acid ABC transporter ATP-binding protein [Clostridium sp.]
MGKLIEVRNVTKSFDDLTVLDELNLKVDSGEVVAIIGSSGSGKSTLVRCITGLESIEQGEIFIRNQSVKGVKSTNGLIGMVFQNFNLFPHYSVVENISKPCEIVKKMSKQEAREKAKKLLDKVHILDKMNQYPSSLSGGQKQRVAIARALAMEPEIMIFDEPSSSLDPELSHEVFESISELAKDGQTMIIVTHEINAIKHFATRVIFLHKGKIEVDGSSSYVLEQCNNPNLKKFLQRVDFGDLK